MKIKFNTNWVVNLIIAVIVIIILLPWLNMLRFTPFFIQSNNFENSWNGHLKPIDDEPNVNLPHYQYKKLQDSINVIRTLRNGNPGMAGSSVFSLVGIQYGFSCDTCSLQTYTRSPHSIQNKDSYIALMGWTIGTENDLHYAQEGKFYVKNGQAYVRQAIIDTTIKKPNGNIYNKITLTDTPVKFRYYEKDGYLLIPISKSLAKVLNIASLSAIGLLIYALYLISAFLRFTADTAKGEIFTAKNVGRLKLIAISLLCLPVGYYVFNYLLKLIFHDYFIPGVVLKNPIMPGLWLILVLAVIFLLLYKAFRQGKLLKEEQDLTV